MALLRDFQVLEIASLRLDRPLLECGDLPERAARRASEARFTALDRLLQTGIDRGVDLAIWHSEMVTADSTAGRAPWFLARWCERYSRAGIPVIWIETAHNRWMQRFVPYPQTLRCLVPSEIAQVSTRSGDIQIQVGRVSDDVVWGDRIHASIGFSDLQSHSVDYSSCDLVLTKRQASSDRVDDFAASQQVNASSSLAAIHTLRTDRANACEVLGSAVIGILPVACGLGSHVTSDQLTQCLVEEIESASRRFLAECPQTLLLLIDLKVQGHGAVWRTLWDDEQCDDLLAKLNGQLQSSVCHVRNLTPVVVDSESDAANEKHRRCAYSSILSTIWPEKSLPSAPELRMLIDHVPVSKTFDATHRWQSLVAASDLDQEVRQATLQMLRAAS